MIKKMKKIIVKNGSLKNIVRDIVDEKIDIPDNAIILDGDVLIKLFTKKRLELIALINKYHPDSIQEIADRSGRKKQAVHRDIKILENIGVVRLKKHGRNIEPIIENDMISIPLKNIGIVSKG